MEHKSHVPNHQAEHDSHHIVNHPVCVPAASGSSSKMLHMASTMDPWQPIPQSQAARSPWAPQNESQNCIQCEAPQ